MDEFQLLSLVAEGEHSRLEFKERPGKDIASVVSGFANAEGGRILEYAMTRKLQLKEVSAMMRKYHQPVFENMICERFVYPDDSRFRRRCLSRYQGSLQFREAEYADSRENTEPLPHRHQRIPARTSIRRNPMICDLLQRAGLAERVGSGIIKMNRICQQEGCEPPSFESAHYFRAIFSSNPKTARQN